MAKNRVRRMTQDPVEIPFYRVGTAARWVGVPAATLEKWVYGRNYPLANGTTGLTPPLIEIADLDKGLLSFANIAEAHILAATRGQGIRLADLRSAIIIAQQANPDGRHPLLTGKFYRRGRKLFVEYLSEKISASSPIQGQRFLTHFDAHLERIEIKQGQYIRLFPVRRNDNKVVVLNSDVAGGQPIIAGTGIMVEYIQDLRKAGLSPRKIADQYGLDEATIVQALAYISSAA